MSHLILADNTYLPVINISQSLTLCPLFMPDVTTGGIPNSLNICCYVSDSVSDGKWRSLVKRLLWLWVFPGRDEDLPQVTLLLEWELQVVLNSWKVCV